MFWNFSFQIELSIFLFSLFLLFRNNLFNSSSDFQISNNVVQKFELDNISFEVSAHSNNKSNLQL